MSVGVYPGQQVVYQTTMTQPLPTTQMQPVIQTTSVQPAGNVVVMQQQPLVGTGACRSCGMGYVKDSYPIEAICLAIWFFPVGLICCLTMKERRCTNCNLRYH